MLHCRAATLLCAALESLTDAVAAVLFTFSFKSKAAGSWGKTRNACRSWRYTLVAGIHALLRWHALRKRSSRHKWQGETVPRKDEPARFFWFSWQKWPHFWSNSLSKSLLSPQYDPTSWSATGNTANNYQASTNQTLILAFKTRQRAIFRRTPLLQYTTLWVFRWCCSCWKSHLEIPRLVDRYTWILALLLSVKHSKLNSNQ